MISILKSEMISILSIWKSWNDFNFKYLKKLKWFQF